MTFTNMARMALVVLASVGVLGQGAEAEDLRVAFGQARPPFVHEEGGAWKGFEIDIVREALAHRGHTIKSKRHVSNARLAREVATGGKDVAVSVQKTGDGTAYSEVFVEYRNYAISRSRDSLTIESIQDLPKYRPVAWQNAYLALGPSYAALFGPEAKGSHLRGYREFADQKAQSAYFWKGRANLILVDKTIFEWFRSQLAGDYETSVDVTYHAIFGEGTPFYVAFRSEKIRDDFNAGLAHLRSSGRYDELVAAYLK